MVQSMIGYGAGEDSQNQSKLRASKDTRLSNIKSQLNMHDNQVPPVEIEESLGKQTEDFGGYTLGDDHRNSGFADGSQRIGGYERAEDSGALEKSAFRQKAIPNIGETSPIHISSNSVNPVQGIGQ